MRRLRMPFIVSRLRYDTWPQALLDVLKAVRVHVCAYRVVREGLCDAARTLGSHEPDGYDTGIASRKHMESFTKFPDRIVPLSALYERLDAGDLCVAAWADGEVIAFTWAHFTEFTYQAGPFRLREDEAYLYDMYTAPAWRGKGVAPHVRSRAYSILADRGRHTLFSVSERFNPASLRFKRKLGAEVVDSGAVVDLFGLWRIGTPPNPDRIRGSSGRG